MANQLDLLTEQDVNEEESEFGDVDGVITIEDDGRAPLTELRAAAEARVAKTRPTQPASVIKLDPACIVEWAHVPLKGSDLDPAELEHQVELMAQHGQRRPVIVRPVVGRPGTFESIGDAWVVAVVTAYAASYPDSAAEVQVEVRDLTDEEAFLIVGRELEAAPQATSYDRGVFYGAAVARFGSEVEAARACGTTKSSVSKNLDVVRAAEALGDKVVVRRDVSQRDAMWLMGVVGRNGDGFDVEDGETRERVLAAIEQLEPGPAKKVFATLRAALRTEKPRRGVTVLMHGGREIGQVRHTTKGGPIRVDLVAEAGDLELDIVVDLIREELAKARRAGSF